MSNKYNQKLLDSAKKSTSDARKTTLKITIQKIAEETGDLIGNKITDKTTIVTKSPKEFHSKEFYSKNLHSKTNENEMEIPKEKLSPKKIQQIIEELRLV